MASNKFTVEFGDSSNRMMLIAALGNQKFRGAFSIAKLHSRPDVGGRAIGEAMGGMPDIPGQRMEIDIRKRTVRVFDPLEGDDSLLSRINSVRNKAESIGGAESGRDFKCIEETEQTLDEHTLKSLIREIALLVDNEGAVLSIGEIPAVKEIDALSGHYLYDPGDTISPNKPRFAEPDGTPIVERKNEVVAGLQSQS